MNNKEYVQKAKRTRSQSRNTYPDLVHMVFGLITETGEIADVFKKNIAYKKPVDFVNLKEEIGDLMWYIANICDLMGWDLDEILETNINKLEVRYPDKFTEDNALNRNLKNERLILEKIKPSEKETIEAELQKLI